MAGQQAANAAEAITNISDKMAKTTDNLVNLVGSGGSAVYGDGTAAVAKVYQDGGNVAGKAAEAVGNSIESLYGTFTNTVLPAVGQGLVITKDYFVDLFSRYAMYLAITDGALVLAELCAIGYFVARIRSVYRTYKSGETTSDSTDVMNILTCIAGVVVIVVATTWITTDFPNFVKDLVVPELRVGQQILEFKASLGK